MSEATFYSDATGAIWSDVSTVVLSASEFASIHLKSEIPDHFEVGPLSNTRLVYSPPKRFFEVTLWDTKAKSLKALCDLRDICGDDFSIRVVGTLY